MQDKVVILTDIWLTACERLEGRQRIPDWARGLELSPSARKLIRAAGLIDEKHKFLAVKIALYRCLLHIPASPPPKRHKTQHTAALRGIPGRRGGAENHAQARAQLNLPR